MAITTSEKRVGERRRKKRSDNSFNDRAAQFFESPVIELPTLPPTPFLSLELDAPEPIVEKEEGSSVSKETYVLV